MFPGVRILHKGVLTLRFIRANEHRAIAIGLPYVLEGLLPTTRAQECALAYNNWRLELSSSVYQKPSVQRAQALSGIASMDTLSVLGSTLQTAMNALNAEVNSCKRQQILRRDDDNDSVRSGTSQHARDMEVDPFACADEDDVYATNLTRQDATFDDKITGLRNYFLF